MEFCAPLNNVTLSDSSFTLHKLCVMWHKPQYYQSVLHGGFLEEPAICTKTENSLKDCGERRVWNRVSPFLAYEEHEANMSLQRHGCSLHRS
jgi:hypothetical protein